MGEVTANSLVILRPLTPYKESLKKKKGDKKGGIDVQYILTTYMATIANIDTRPYRNTKPSS
jgi:hypothetical protein